MITTPFVHFQKYSTFVTKKIGANVENTKYTLGDDTEIFDGIPDISYESVIYIKDAKKTYTHNGCYDCIEHAFYTKRYDFAESSAFAELTTTDTTYDETNKQIKVASGGTITLKFPRNTQYYVALKVKSVEGETPYVTVGDTNYTLKGNTVTLIPISNTFSSILTFSNATSLEYITIQESDMAIPTKLSQLTNDVGYLVGETEGEMLKLIVK